MRWLLIVLLLEPLPAATIDRAAIHLNGVTSNRGFFNVFIRLRQIEGIEWTKFDLRKSMITVDFAPGKSVTSEQLREACRSAGYKPGTSGSM